MVEVLAINASPRKYGNSYKLLRVAVEATRYAGAEAKVLHLYDYRIGPCLGCVSDSQLDCRYPCPIDLDDANGVLKSIVESDALIISTPVYWYGPSGHLKNLIDRMTSLENMIFVSGRSLMEGKVVGLIAVGAESGNVFAVAQLMTTLNSMGAAMPPWAFAYYVGQGDALESRESVLDAANVGYLVSRAAQGCHPKMLRYNPSLLDELGGKKLLERIAAETRELYRAEHSKRVELIGSRGRGSVEEVV